MKRLCSHIYKEIIIYKHGNIKNPPYSMGKIIKCKICGQTKEIGFCGTKYKKNDPYKLLKGGKNII